MAVDDKVKTTCLAAALLAFAALVYTYSSYRQYVSLGDHGLPGNFSGWYQQLKWHRIARTDTRKPAPYTDHDLGSPIYTEETKKSYLSEKEIPSRVGLRPTVPGFVAPQRQTTQRPSRRMLEMQTKFFEDTGTLNPTLFTVKTSGIEKFGTALWVAPDREIPPIIKLLKGEFAHIHPEGSVHLFLSLPDAERVIANGWGERHKLTGPRIPWGYTLVYAPRDDGEFEVWKDIVKASIRYFAGKSEVSYTA
ncbi:phospholipase/carboxylesterase [Fusarium austroafricanum]|uniref:Phospholipase/carboxylesterase n=1 Tax=Fusarium austroafricanum TaxID=2364996 RepID=A0A8H4K9Z5_9HYPO|nr:phospholipase/carboxylesterase [Fusarium austroafricanum]